MPEIDWAHMADLADKAARSVANAWPNVEKDDVKQTILLHAYERRPMLEEHAGNEIFLAQFCKKVGTQHASAVRDALDVEDGGYYYTPDEARMALMTFIYSDDELGQMLGREDDLLKCRITDNLVTARIDASVAMNRLPKHVQTILMKRYVYGIPPSDPTERKASNRAVDVLARQMNRDNRKVNA